MDHLEQRMFPNSLAPNSEHCTNLQCFRKEMKASSLVCSLPDNFLNCINCSDCDEIVGKGRRWELPSVTPFGLITGYELSYTLRGHIQFIPKWVKFGPANLGLILLLEIIQKSKVYCYACWITVEYIKYHWDGKDFIRFS